MRPLQVAYFIKENLGQYGDKLKKIFGLWSHNQPQAAAFLRSEWTIRHKNRALAMPARLLLFKPLGVLSITVLNNIVTDI
jgi:hypothetical protein